LVSSNSLSSDRAACDNRGPPFFAFPFVSIAFFLKPLIALTHKVSSLSCSYISFLPIHDLRFRILLPVPRPTSSNPLPPLFSTLLPLLPLSPPRSALYGFLELRWARAPLPPFPAGSSASGQPHSSVVPTRIWPYCRHLKQRRARFQALTSSLLAGENSTGFSSDQNGLDRSLIHYWSPASRSFPRTTFTMFTCEPCVRSLRAGRGDFFGNMADQGRDCIKFARDGQRVDLQTTGKAVP
jgi:hypothetical protein